MALFCFWSRRACSHYVVLGESIPDGSRLAAHIARCSACRVYWSDLQSLNSDLDRFIAVPQPSLQFAEPIWEHVKPSNTRVAWSRVSLAAAVAVGLVCGWAFWRTGSTRPSGRSAETVARTLPKFNIEPAVVAPPTSTAPSQEASAPSLHRADIVRLSPRHSRIVWMPAPRSHHYSQSVPRRHPRFDTLPLPQGTGDLSGEWRESGLMFESQGDPGLANVAYQAAYQERPSEQTAFDMGRSAEESGDVEQALDVYASLLDTADAKSRSEKGWTP